MKYLFQKYQNELVKLANRKEGRKLFEIPDKWKNLPCLQVGTNHLTFHLGGRKIIGKFYVGTNKVADILGESLTSSDIIEQVDTNSLLHYLGVKPQNFYYPQVMYVTNYNTTAGDGYCGHGFDATWAAAHDATTTADVVYNATTNLIAYVETRSNPLFYINRGFMPSDTSGLSASATIISGNLSVYTITKADDFTTSVELVQTSQASSSSLTGDDYNNLVFSSIGTKNIADFSTSAYNSITISDLTKISKTGVTYIGTITGKDLTNTAPPTTSALSSYINVNMSENASNKPYYAIVYNLPGGSAFFFSQL